MADAPDSAREAARKRIEERRGFVPHLIVYLIVNGGIVAIWFSTGASGFFWPGIIIIALWGIGVVMHAWNAFFTKPVTEADVDKEMSRWRDKPGPS